MTSDDLTRDGFRVAKTTFVLPRNVDQLDPQAKRRATICNLFVNHQLAIPDVVRVLDETYRYAVKVLIEQGVLEDRRSAPRAADNSSHRFGLRSRSGRPFKTS